MCLVNCISGGSFLFYLIYFFWRVSFGVCVMFALSVGFGFLFRSEGGSAFFFFGVACCCLRWRPLSSVSLGGAGVGSVFVGCCSVSGFWAVGFVPGGRFWLGSCSLGWRWVWIVGFLV